MVNAGYKCQFAALDDVHRYQLSHILLQTEALALEVLKVKTVIETSESQSK